MTAVNKIKAMAYDHDFSRGWLLKSIILSNHNDYTEELAEEALILIELAEEDPVGVVKLMGRELADLEVKCRDIRKARYYDK